MTKYDEAMLNIQKILEEKNKELENLKKEITNLSHVDISLSYWQDFANRDINFAMKIINVLENYKELIRNKKVISVVFGVIFGILISWISACLIPSIPALDFILKYIFGGLIGTVSGIGLGIHQYHVTTQDYISIKRTYDLDYIRNFLEKNQESLEKIEEKKLEVNHKIQDNNFLTDLLEKSIKELKNLIDFLKCQEQIAKENVIASMNDSYEREMNNRFDCDVDLGIRLARIKNN